MVQPGSGQFRTFSGKGEGATLGWLTHGYAKEAGRNPPRCSLDRGGLGAADRHGTETQSAYTLRVADPVRPAEIAGNSSLAEAH